jgi:muramoyltetrapeptide carboxypeptidase
MLSSYLKKYDIPVMCGFPAGHGDVNLPLVMGAPVTIDVRNDGATLLFNIDGEQRDVTTSTVIATPTPLTDRLRRSGKIL